MTHVADADHELARKASALFGGDVPAWKVAKLREAGLITWAQPRPGKRGRPGRAHGSYSQGTERQVVQALDLIRSKIGTGTVAAVLYLKGWPVSITARQRFLREWAALVRERFPRAIAKLAGDGAWEELHSSRAEMARIFRSILGGQTDEALLWLHEAFSGNLSAIEAPHPALMSALRLLPLGSVDAINYDDPDFVEFEAPPHLLTMTRRWGEIGQLLLNPDAVEQRLLANGANEIEWQRARTLAQAFVHDEQARRALATVLPKLAAAAQVPMERLLTEARRGSTAEAKAAYLMVIRLIDPIDDAQTQEMLDWRLRRRAQLEACTVLGRDCPSRMRGKLDDVIFSDDVPGSDRVQTWFERWAKRKPAIAVTVQEAVGARS